MDLPAELRRHRIAYLLFAVSLAATGVATGILWFSEKRKMNERVESWAATIRTALLNRMETHAQILRGGAALYRLGLPVDRARWKTWVDAQDLDQNFPGIQGVGFSRWIPAEEKARREAAVRAEGFPAYAIKPAGDRPIYTAIEYLEPFRDRNLRAFGYDMYSEPVRREALDRAIATGLPALSGKVVLLQETGKDPQAGCLLYVPIYRQDLPCDTAEERRLALIGFAYSPFRMGDLIRGALMNYLSRVDVELYDGTAVSASNLLYANRTDRTSPAPVDLARMVVAGRAWTLAVSGNAELIAEAKDGRILALGIGGIILSIFILLLLRSLTGAREMAEEMVEQKTRELAASEERFSLAVRGSNDGIWDWNLETDEIWFSPRWKEQLGYTDSEIPNSLEAWGQLIFPEDRENAMQLVDAYNKGTLPVFEAVQRFRHKDGHTVFIHTRAVNKRDGKGKAVRLVGAHTDITRRMNAEEQVRRQSGRIQTLYELASIQKASIEAQVQDALRLGLDWFGMELGILSRVTGDRYQVDQVETRGPNIKAGQAFPLNDTYCQVAFSANEPVSFHHAALSEWYRHPCYRQTRLESYLGTPVLVNQERWGTLTFSSTRPHAAPFPKEDHDILRLLARWVGYLLERRLDEAELARQRRELERIAVTDQLTGLGNRRHFETLVDPAFAMALRHERPFAIALADIDHFKRINDTWGHAVGDAALKGLAETARRTFRKSDIVCRWGGEEFIIALPETPWPTALDALERFRQNLKQNPPLDGEGKPIAMTVSVGLALRRPDEIDWDLMVRRADGALYKAKQDGRDRLVCDDPPA